MSENVIRRLEGVCDQEMTCKDCKHVTHDLFRLDFPFGCAVKAYQRMTEQGCRAERVCKSYEKKEGESSDETMPDLREKVPVTDQPEVLF